jgi:hypothetical protein
LICLPLIQAQEEAVVALAGARAVLALVAALISPVKLMGRW